MKLLINTALVLLIVTCSMSFSMWSRYDQIDAYNNAAMSYEWLTRPVKSAEEMYVMRTGDRYFIGMENYGDECGIMDESGRMVLPCRYYAAEYHGGEYLAAATDDEWVLTDTDGKKLKVFNRIRYPYAYAGDRYFIRYGDDPVEEASDGVFIVDALSGETKAAYEDCYNAVRMDDGNWFICRSIAPEGIAARYVLDEKGEYSCDSSSADSSAGAYGFFTDEDFSPLFGGAEYELICHGDGVYVVKTIGKDDTGQYIILDGEGELFTVTDDSLIERISTYENRKHDMRYMETVTRSREGNIGFADLEDVRRAICYSEDGEPYTGIGAGMNPRYKAAGEWTVYMERINDGYDERIIYGLKDKAGDTVLPAICKEMIFLPDTNNIMINGPAGCGIISLEVKET